MNDFSWTNIDVLGKLQELKSKEVNLADIVNFLKEQYNKKCAAMTIYRHLPSEVTKDTFLERNDVM